MNITITPRGILQIDDAKIVWRNFSGEASKFNRAGDRNFALVIPDQETAELLMDEGWNIKIKPAREEGDSPFMTLAVKIKFNDRGPICYLQTNGRRIRLKEETINTLDKIDIANVDLDVRPYDWNVNGKEGRTAYLHSICVTQNIVDRFAEEEFPTE